MAHPHTHSVRELDPSAALAATIALALGATQIVAFAPTAAAGRAVDMGIFRADALALVAGMLWCVAVALAVGVRLQGSGLRFAGPVAMLVGPLVAAYAREPLALYAGWEVAGLGLLWAASEGKRSRAPGLWVSVVAPGLPLLLAILLGVVPAFAPPAGGEARPWPLALCLVFGAAALVRSGCPPFHSWVRAATGRNPAVAPLAAVYLMASAFMPARALVARPWDEAGVWALALFGSASLCACAYLASRDISTERGSLLTVAGLGAAVLVGLGLAPVAPLAAVGAALLLLGGTLWATGPNSGPLLLLALAPGAWALTQGALDAHYEVVAALMSPALALLALSWAAGGRAIRREPRIRVILLVVALFPAAMAAYPQAAVQWAARPAVSAMAGGVGSPLMPAVQWGVGLLVRAPSEALAAALPATGVAVAVILAGAALYWAKLLAVRFAGRPEAGGE